jgi:transposase
MEGFAEGLSESHDLLATIGRMGACGAVAEALAFVRPAIGSAATGGLERMLHGRDIRPGQKRGLCVGNTRKGKGTKLMVLVDGQGLPLGVYLSSANRAESDLAEVTVESRVTDKKPRIIVADKGYDAKALWERFRKYNVDLIVPHRRNRKERFQDGRRLRRYRHRWIVERTNAWLFNFRRLVVRYDREIAHFRAFVHLACAMIVLRRF